MIKDKSLLMYLDKENKVGYSNSEIKEKLVKASCWTSYKNFKAIILALVFNTIFAKSGVKYIDNMEKSWQVLTIDRFQAIEKGLNKFIDNVRLTLVIVFILSLILGLIPLIPIIGLISYLSEKSFKKKVNFINKTIMLYGNYSSGEFDYKLKDAVDNFLSEPTK